MRAMRGAAAVAAAGLFLAGCGGTDELSTIAVSNEKGGGAELFAAMSEAQVEAGSYRFELDMGGESEQMTATGAAQYGDDLSEIDITMTMQTPAASEMGELTMLLVDGQFYLSAPQAGLPEETPWLTVDPSGDDMFSKMFSSVTKQLSNSADLQASFEENAELIAVEEVGSDTIDGIDVTEYELTITGDDLAAFMDASAGEVPFEELRYSLWVDGDALPRQLSSDLGGKGTMEMRFSDFGDEVEVSAPAKDEVTDFGSMMNGLLGDIDMEDLGPEERAELEGLMPGGGLPTPSS